MKDPVAILFWTKKEEYFHVKATQDQGTGRGRYSAASPAEMCKYLLKRHTSKEAW